MDQESLEVDWQFPYIDKTIRLAVSGDVLITELERKIIDTPAFQRLRKVRQLGASSLVFPTALHTRFDHSIGTLSMVETMIQSINSDAAKYKRADSVGHTALKISDIQRALARLYALLHDIAHIPFGHTLEDEMSVFPRHDESQARFDHFIGEGTEICNLIRAGLPADGYERLTRIYFHGKKKQLPHHDEIVYHLVSDTVCADLLDYIQRDSAFCNLGIAFEYRFLNFLYLRDKKVVEGEGADRKTLELRRPLVRLWKGGSGQPRRDTLTDLVRLLEARYMIAERVYFHRAKVAAGTMLSRAIYEAKEAKTLTEEDLWDMGDDTLLDFLCAGAHPPLTRTLAEGFKARKLFKQAAYYSPQHIKIAVPHEHDIARADNLTEISEPGLRKKAEDRIAEMAGCSAGQILIYAPHDRTGNPKVSKVNVLWNGDIKEFREIDDPIARQRLNSIIEAHEYLSGVYLFVDPSIDSDARQRAVRTFETMYLLPGNSHLVNRLDNMKAVALHQFAQHRELWDKCAGSNHAKAEYEAAQLLLDIIGGTTVAAVSITELMRDVLIRHVPSPTLEV